MIDIYYNPEFTEFRPLIEALFPRLFPSSKNYCNNTRSTNAVTVDIPTFNSIPVSRVTYSGNKTIVWFTDNTKAIVTCSPNDNYDRQTAIAYALVKRLFGKVDPKTGIVDGNGLGLKLEKIAANGFDQEAEKRSLDAKKAAAKAKHEALQKAQHDAAWEKKVRARAEQIRLERDAEALLAREADSLSKTAKPKTLLTEVKRTKKASAVASDWTDWRQYVRPNKPFSKFTSEEKKEYWRAHGAKRRELGK